MFKIELLQAGPSMATRWQKTDPELAALADRCKAEGNEIFKKLLMSLGMKKKIIQPKLLLNDMPNCFQHALIVWFFLINFVEMYINYHSAKKKVCGVQS